MNIGILYIAIGKYNIFFKDFYNSSEKFFFQHANKHYYVFTDQPHILSLTNSNISIFYQENKGWPYNTLMRFHMFNSIKEKLNNEDYLFFFNANAMFLQKVDDEILPDAKENYLVSAMHPGFLNKAKIEFPYERNEKSTAFIPNSKGTHYFQGCFFGGKTQNFLELTQQCMQNIDVDFNNNIIAIWHDESHLNSYFTQHPPKVLNSSYIYPEDKPIKGLTPIILMRDKKKYGGHDFLRGTPKNKIITFIKRFLHKIYH
ncbi:family 6 glucosyltransferase [Phocaeicola coprophilus]|uniref:family 6 glucosyltransferase n=1 Tax=Phocaeicola coprophilus TaxID=387090 RepID=UPI0039916841